MLEQITGFATLDPVIAKGIGAAAIGLLIFAAFMVLIIYVYSALTMMFTAQKLKTEPTWLAWIPIANLVLVAKMAKMHWWPVLLIIGAFIPYVGFLFSLALMVFYIIWLWNICEYRKKDGWWAILIIIPFLGSLWHLVLWGILAWSK